MSIIYLWSQYYSDRIVNFIFGLRFQGKYFPYVLVIFEALQMGGGLPWESIIGLFTGHAYHYLTDTYPANGGPRLLTTPGWLYSIFPLSSTPTSTTFGTAYPGRLSQQQQQSSRVGGNPASATTTRSSTSNWGRETTQEFTLLELAKYNTKELYYLCIKGKVYNVTEFIKEHPGGEEIILDVVGKDATQFFEDIGHSDDALQLLKTLEIG
ncbi:13564_t:CDS:2, partial [Entrophospora sp. SA101]